MKLKLDENVPGFAKGQPGALGFDADAVPDDAAFDPLSRDDCSWIDDSDRLPSQLMWFRSAAARTVPGAGGEVVQVPSIVVSGMIRDVDSDPVARGRTAVVREVVRTAGDLGRQGLAGRHAPDPPRS